MPKFKPYRKDQIMLFPKTIDEYVPQNHLAWLIHNILEELDTSNIGNSYSSLGQNTYHPKILIKLLFYGYATGQRSGRKVAANRRTKTKEEYQNWLIRIDEKIQQILSEVEATDTKEDQLFKDKRGDELPGQINDQQKPKGKIQEIMGKFKDEKEKINLTDPESKFMKDGRYLVDTNYNCQVALNKEQFVLVSEVITLCPEGKIHLRYGEKNVPTGNFRLRSIKPKIALPATRSHSAPDSNINRELFRGGEI